MSLIDINEIEPREMAPGYKGRFLHSESMTHSYVNIEAGAALPEHSHPHEQIVTVLEGELELIVEETPHRLTRGKVFILPSNVPHAAVAITDVFVLDTFNPVREDLR